MTAESFKQKVISELKTIKKTEIEELKNFVSYWSEKTKSGSLIRYDLQKTFDIPRRWGMWKRRAKEYNHKQTVLKPPTWQPPKELTPEERARGRAKLEEMRRRLNLKKIG